MDTQAFCLRSTNTCRRRIHDWTQWHASTPPWTPETCHTPAPDSPDWPPTHLWDPTYLPTCTLDSGHSDIPMTPGTLVSCPTDLKCLPTCLPATPEDSTWLGSNMKM